MKSDEILPEYGLTTGDFLNLSVRLVFLRVFYSVISMVETTEVVVLSYASKVLTGIKFYDEYVSNLWDEFISFLFDYSFVLARNLY